MACFSCSGYVSFISYSARRLPLFVPGVCRPFCCCLSSLGKRKKGKRRQTFASNGLIQVHSNNASKQTRYRHACDAIIRAARCAHWAKRQRSKVRRNRSAAPRLLLRCLPASTVGNNAPFRPKTCRAVIHTVCASCRCHFRRLPSPVSLLSAGSKLFLFRCTSIATGDGTKAR